MFRRSRSGVISLILLAIFFAGFVLYPLFTLGLESVKGEGGFSFQHYAQLLDPGQSGNVEAVFNSVYVALLSVVLGTTSEGARAAESQKLLNYGFQFYVLSDAIRISVAPGSGKPGNHTGCTTAARWCAGISSGVW